MNNNLNVKMVIIYSSADRSANGHLLAGTYSLESAEINDAGRPAKDRD